ncbi:MAG: hypothetical protein K2H41_12630 [Acetatifactor sp.]|nr:hypothetical protein [Acetatifactor sp.]
MKDEFESVETTETEEINDVEETETETADKLETENDFVSTDETVQSDVSSGDSSHDASGIDVSSGDVSTGDVSAGDVSGGSSSENRTVYNIPETLEVTCTCHDDTPPLLWESDIAQYSITDGLLLLILITLALDVALFRRK